MKKKIWMRYSEGHVNIEKNVKRKTIIGLMWVCLAVFLVIFVNSFRVDAATNRILSLDSDSVYSNAELAGYNRVNVNGYKLTVSDSFTTSASITLGKNGTLVVNGNMVSSGKLECSNGTVNINGNYTQRENVFYASGSTVTVSGDFSVVGSGSYSGVNGIITIRGNIYYSSTENSYNNFDTWYVSGNIVQNESTGFYDAGSVVLVGRGEQKLSLKQNSRIDSITPTNTNIRVEGYLNYVTLKGNLSPKMDSDFYSNGLYVSQYTLTLPHGLVIVDDENSPYYNLKFDQNGLLVVNGDMTADGDLYAEYGTINVLGDYSQKTGRINLLQSQINISGDAEFAKIQDDNNDPNTVDINNSDVHIGGNMDVYSAYANATTFYLKGNLIQNSEDFTTFQMGKVILEGKKEQVISLKMWSKIVSLTPTNPNISIPQFGNISATLNGDFNPKTGSQVYTDGLNLNGYKASFSGNLIVSALATVVTGNGGVLNVSGDLDGKLDCSSGTVNVGKNLSLNTIVSDEKSIVSVGGDLRYWASSDCESNLGTWTVAGNFEQSQNSGKVFFKHLTMSTVGSKIVILNGTIDVLELAGPKSQYDISNDNCYKTLVTTTQVTFDANGGALNGAGKIVKTNQTYGTLPTASRSGYSFAGWFTSPEGGQQVTSSTIVSEVENSTLYAHWTPGAGPDFSIFDVPEGCAMQARMYNPNSGEHFYTGSIEEVQNLINAGWNFEGPGFITPTTGIPIYRLYSEEHGDHFYTTNEAERDMLASDGWKLEGTNNGIAFPSASAADGVPMYRLQNPNAYPNGEAGAHHFTTSMQEVHNLEAAGWEYEGIAWYSL